MTTENRVTRLEDVVSDIRDRLSRLEIRMDSLETRMDSLESKMDSLESRLETQFRWMIGITITLWSTTLLGVVATLLAVTLQS